MGSPASSPNRKLGVVCVCVSCREGGRTGKVRVCVERAERGKLKAATTASLRAQPKWKHPTWFPSAMPTAHALRPARHRPHRSDAINPATYQPGSHYRPEPHYDAHPQETQPEGIQYDHICCTTHTHETAKYRGYGGGRLRQVQEGQEGRHE